ncbi:MAG: hypothetical protein GTO30_10365 [Acidobacteria bacterium]|nr:hypothetical protein [Acidobacteriota bacterium]NIM62036.1 hypothetical protein [Acidobacteriota bacterium]NIQ85840.1 hypothetical protein [Acidobacteriota bacterium]NIT11391.1 hypothetical protein [Acidobacteriota bacterium]
MRILVIFLLLFQVVPPSANRGKDKEDAAAATQTLAVVGHHGHAYVGQTGGMLIHDVSDPIRPKDVSWFPLPSAVSDIVIDDNHAFLAAGTRGLVIVDIANPAEPVELGRLDTDGKVKRVARSGRHLFLADGSGGLLVVDIEMLEDPRVVARVSTGGDLRAVAVGGELLAVAEGHGGARVFDLRRPDNPREVAKLETRFAARDVCWIGDRLFVAAGSEGTALYEPQVSTRPIEFLPPVRSAQHVACGARLIAVSNLGSAIQLFDTSESRSPRERSRLRVHRSAPIGRAGFDGTHLWIAADVAGMGLLDVSNADEPERLLPRAREFKVSY